MCRRVQLNGGRHAGADAWQRVPVLQHQPELSFKRSALPNWTPHATCCRTEIGIAFLFAVAHSNA